MTTYSSFIEVSLHKALVTIGLPYLFCNEASFMQTLLLHTLLKYLYINVLSLGLFRSLDFSDKKFYSTFVISLNDCDDVEVSLPWIKLDAAIAWRFFVKNGSNVHIIFFGQICNYNYHTDITLTINTNRSCYHSSLLLLLFVLYCFNGKIIQPCSRTFLIAAKDLALIRLIP